MPSVEFSPEEQAVIEELRRRTTDCVTPKMLEDNLLFYRFAKARDFKLAEAESMLRKSAAWRKEMGIDTIQTDYKPPEVLVKYFPSVLLGFDKEGCAVRYTDAGRTDAKGLFNCANKKELMKYCSYLMEDDLETMLKRNKKLHRQCYFYVHNFENMPLAAATHMKTLQYLLYGVKTYLDNFPEKLKYVFVINAPFYFVWMYTVLKQILPATVIEKVRIYGTDGWQEYLRHFIDADVLPAFMGGKRTDPDGNPQCNTIVMCGTLIPKSYYLKQEKRKLSANFEKVTILPLSKQELSFEVAEPNSTLEWEYDLEGRDIDFALTRRESVGTVELIPKERKDTRYETEKGFFQCDKAGTYTIVFDNAYSWIHTKEVYCKVIVNPPSDGKSEHYL